MVACVQRHRSVGSRRQKYGSHPTLIKGKCLEVIVVKAASFACTSIWGRLVYEGRRCVWGGGNLIYVPGDRFWIQTPNGRSLPVHAPEQEALTSSNIDTQYVHICSTWTKNLIYDLVGWPGGEVILNTKADRRPGSMLCVQRVYELIVSEQVAALERDIIATSSRQRPIVALTLRLQPSLNPLIWAAR